MIYDDWIRDLPQEFQNGEKINIFIKAFAKQLDEIYKMFNDLNKLTDLETANGKNLDYVGTIIPLTRKEAANMFQKNENINDDLYRKFLKFKLKKSTNECTYYDIINSIVDLFGFQNIFYEEPEDNPATIVLKIPELMLNEENQWIFNYPLIKAAGVNLKIKKYDVPRIEMDQYIAIPLYKRCKIVISM